MKLTGIEKKNSKILLVLVAQNLTKHLYKRLGVNTSYKGWKIIYWNLYNASKKILETKNMLSKLHLNKQPDYYLELAYNKLQTELDNIYLTPGERESLRNNVRLNKDIILE